MEINKQINYYRILFLTYDFDATTLKKNYRELSKTNHPDKTNGDDTAFKYINEAYKILGDNKLRKKYDLESKHGQYYNEDVELSDFDFSNQEVTNGMMSNSKTSFIKDYMLHILLEFNEFQEVVKYKRNTVCTKCDGIGTTDLGDSSKLSELFGSDEYPCDICDGSGNYNGNDCPACKGDGYIKIGFSECDNCLGRGLVEKPKKIIIKESDLIDGKLKMGNFGNYSKEGRIGNLYIVIKDED